MGLTACLMTSLMGRTPRKSIGCWLPYTAPLNYLQNANKESSASTALWAVGQP
jgi:hypothetical protein